MESQSLNYSEAFSEKFSIASLLYIRLRRATSRVIDAMYISENDAYAQHVIELALATEDQELHHLAQRLQSLIPQAEAKHELQESNKTTDAEEDIFRAEPTEEDILREQVSHHYIGSLR